MVLILSAPSGVEVGTEKVWDQAQQSCLPSLIFINKMDKENANFRNSLNLSQERLSPKVTPLQIPIGEGSSFKGIVDLLKNKTYIYSQGKVEEGDIPDELKEEAGNLREKLIESIAESDDALLEKYLESGSLSEEEIKKGLKKAITTRSIIPLLCGSALRDMGTEALLDTVVNSLPSPVDRGEIKGVNPKNEEEEKRAPDESRAFSALVFKTRVEPHVGQMNFFRVYSGKISSGQEVYNATSQNRERMGQLVITQGREQKKVSEVRVGDMIAALKLKYTNTGDTLCDPSRPIILEGPRFPEPIISLALKPSSKKDQEKLSTALRELVSEDPTLNWHMEHEFGEAIISGMGELHLEVLIGRLKRKFGVEVVLGKPRIAYRETIRAKTKAQGKYKKQTGGRGQYGDCRIEIEPLELGKGFEFVNDIFGGAIPAKYIPSVEKGVQQAIAKGVLAGYPVVDIKVTLYDGSFHEVDSSDIAFKIAGSLAFKKAVQEAKPVLLEPVMSIEVLAPEEYMGDLNGDLNSRRGRIMGIEAKGRNQIIKAQVPLAEMYKYATSLKSITHGQGTYSMKFSHYEEVPSRIAQEIIAQSKKKEE
ncbi:Elongation factor G [subsurface metagenome]